jgi:hypothetical protein
MVSYNHYTLWSIWMNLPALQRLFCLILSLVGIYTMFSATLIMVRIRSLANQHEVEDVLLFNASWLRFMLALRICANSLALLFIFLGSYSL